MCLPGLQSVLLTRYRALVENRMGIVRLPDEIGKMIDSQVALGRARSASAFVEEAVLRLLDDARAEEAEIAEAAAVGIADIEAGRFVVVSTAEESRKLFEGFAARMRSALSAET